MNVIDSTIWEMMGELLSANPHSRGAPRKILNSDKILIK
jgi:hypothetical protein